MKDVIIKVEVGKAYTTKRGDKLINHSYEFQSGLSGQASHKTQFPYGEGEEVYVDVVKDHPFYGKKLAVSSNKIVKQVTKEELNKKRELLKWALTTCVTPGKPIDQEKLISNAEALLDALEKMSSNRC
jgi:hypothetical protein